MKPIAPEYEAPEADYETIPDGIYTPESISFMEKSLDSATQRPKLIDSTYGPIVMFDLSIVGNEEDTIPLSCRLNEVPYMVQAFTNNVATLLPPVPALDQVQAIETYLLLAAQLCNEGTLRPNIGVKKGWGSVYRLTDSRLPVGNYHGYFTDILPKNSVGLPAPEQSVRFPDSYQFSGLFLIVADQYGERCGWSGTQYFQRYMGYKATAVHNEKGELVADWVRGKKTNEYTRTAKEFSTFVITTAPSLFPEEGTPRFTDPRNICPEWLLAVHRDRVLLSLSIGVNDKGFSVLDITKVFQADPTKLRFDVAANAPPQPIPQSTPPSPQPQSQLPVKEHTESPLVATRPVPPSVPPVADKHLQLFCQLLNVFIADDDTGFIVPFVKSVFTDSQKQIIQLYVAPFKTQLSTPKLNKFTLGDVGIIFENLPFETLQNTPNILTKISEIYQQLELDEADAF